MFIILVTTFSQPALAKEWNLKTSIDVNKLWEVKFSKPLDERTMIADNIYVLDGKKKHATTLELAGDGSILQVSPDTPYEVGKSYMLMITRDVKSTDGKALTESVEFPFQITGHIQDIYSTSNSIVTTITVKASRDVNRVTVGSEEMRYEGKNIHKLPLIGAKPGSTVTITAYDVDNKRLDRISYKLGSTN